MFTSKENRTDIFKYDNEKGEHEITIEKLVTHDKKPQSLNMYAHITLVPDGEVKYHVHTGESETYYILSGTGLYNDNGNEITVKPGDVTFTANGEGHGLKNIGNEDLSFMALIIKD